MCATRGVDARTMEKRQLREDGIFFPAVKQGEEVLIEWSDELYAAVLGILAWSDAITERRHVACGYLIAAKSGGPYTAHGWKTTVYKIVRAAIGDAENPLEEPFSFHDLRARSATDEDELYGRNPKTRLRHKRQATTDIYMRGKRLKRVKPLPLRKVS
jgi:integrase